MKTILYNILLLLLLSIYPAFSQTTPVKDPLLDNLVGKWILKGTIGGQETTHDIMADWVLDHQYIELNEVSREKDPNGLPLYEAKVFITLDQRLNQYTCLWLDNTGNGGLSPQAIGHADPKGDKLEFIFKISESNVFQTTFIFDKDSNSWQWQMDNRENNSIQPFARVRLTRQN